MNAHQPVAGSTSPQPDANDPVERARSVAGLLREARRSIEAARELPAGVVGALHDKRLFRLLLPKALGGDETDPVTFAKVTEVISAADASTAWCIGQGGGCAMSAAFMDPAAAERLFGPRDAVLAWGAGVQGTAVAVSGGYRVSGTWTFASGSRHATLLGAHCRVMEADGRPRMTADGKHADRTALFPRSKARIMDVWDVMGLKGTGSDSYEVKDLFVPEADTINREAQSELRVKVPTYRIPTTMMYAAGFGGVMLGIARGTLDDLKALAMTKTARGATSSMRDSQVFQTDLARMEARWRAARALHHAAFGEVWSALSAGGALTFDLRVNARLAATHTIVEGVDLVAEAYKAAGQNAIFRENPFEQRLRDAHAASQQVQGRPTHYMTVGRHLLELAPDTTMFI